SEEHTSELQSRFELVCRLLLEKKKLGARVARVGAAFDMSVIAWSEHLTAERAAECGATLVTKDELFARSDVVSIHVQLSALTRGLVGARELGLMKPTAYLINTARGPIVDEAALANTLQARGIAVFFFNVSAAAEFYTLSLHDALPI